MGKGKLKNDRYQVRKAEGRAGHGMTSVTSMIVSCLAFMLQVASVAMPYWRTSWVGVLGYPSRRSWGIFAVQGSLNQAHHTISTNTCGWYGSLNVGGICASPICVWYKMKCELYLDMMIYSYSIGFALAIEMLIHMLCIIWTAKMTPRFLRWAATWYPVCIILWVAAMVTWFVITEQTFEELDAKSYYPTPPPGASCIFSSIAGFGVLICAMLACSLHRMWPEVDEDDEDGEEEEDTEDEDGVADLKKSKQAQMQGGMDPNARGMDPNAQWQDPSMMGMGYQDPSMMGYQDPAMMGGGMDGQWQQPMPGQGWDQPMPQQQQQGYTQDNGSMPALPQ